MKVFITGACGEIGTRTSHLFIDAGHTVVAFDIRPEPSSNTRLRKGLNYVKGDATDYQAVMKSMEGCTAVIHLAAGVGPGDGVLGYHNMNVVSSWNVLRAAAEVGLYIR